MFTWDEVIDVALGIEQAGEETYRQAAKVAHEILRFPRPLNGWRMTRHGTKSGLPTCGLSSRRPNRHQKWKRSPAP